jgi:LacI family transcriptional regulator
MSRKITRKPTIRDVAQEVGVHHSTVSRALNPNKQSKISPEVVKKIKKTAEKLGYFPNILASSLKQNRSFSIGILIPDLINSVFPPIIRGVQDTAEAAGFTVMIANTDDEEEKEQLALRAMQGRSIEGIIIATARLNDPVVVECIRLNVPIVLVNRSVEQEGVNAVIVDEDFAMRCTLDHLFSLKHSRIAHIAGPQDTSTGAERAMFFANYMKLKGYETDLVETTEKFTVECGYKACKKLLARGEDFTALVCGSDQIALGCLDAIEEAGLSVPNDVSVVGNNDIPLLDRMSPSLTTISIPKYEMGAQATKILLDMIDAASTEPVVIKMRPKLIVRNSTALQP